MITQTVVVMDLNAAFKLKKKREEKVFRGQKTERVENFGSGVRKAYARVRLLRLSRTSRRIQRRIVNPLPS